MAGETTGGYWQYKRQRICRKWENRASWKPIPIFLFRFATFFLCFLKFQFRTLTQNRPKSKSLIMATLPDSLFGEPSAAERTTAPKSNTSHPPNSDLNKVSIEKLILALHNAHTRERALQLLSQVLSVNEFDILQSLRLLCLVSGDEQAIILILQIFFRSRVRAK